MIVLDASAAVDWLLQTPAGQSIEKRIYSQNETLHAPHLLRSRGHAGTKASRIASEWSRSVVLTRRSAICWTFVLLAIRMSCSCPEFGNCVTLFLPTKLPILCLPKNSELH